MAGFFVFVVRVAIGLFFFYQSLAHDATFVKANEFPSPRLETRSDGLRDPEIARQQADFDGFRWIDRTHGVFQVPIERAMQLVAARGAKAYDPWRRQLALAAAAKEGRRNENLSQCAPSRLRSRDRPSSRRAGRCAGARARSLADVGVRPRRPARASLSTRRLTDLDGRPMTLGAAIGAPSIRRDLRRLRLSAALLADPRRSPAPRLQAAASSRASTIDSW